MKGFSVLFPDNPVAFETKVFAFCCVCQGWLTTVQLVLHVYTKSKSNKVVIVYCEINRVANMEINTYQFLTQLINTYLVVSVCIFIGFAIKLIGWFLWIKNN